jgi:hypothetical protein
VRLPPLVLAGLLLTLAVAAAHAQPMTGAEYGAGADGTSAGVWDLFHVNVCNDWVNGTATLTWARTSPAPLDEQYDLTIWARNADANGFLSSSDVLYRSWGPTVQPTRTLSFSLPPLPTCDVNHDWYVFTVEPTQSLGAPYQLDSSSVWFWWAGYTVGTKLNLP